jgi:lysophospholipase L1-like esterase
MKPVSAKAFLLGLSLALAGCAGGALDVDESIYVAVGASDAVGIGAVPLRNGYVFRIRDELEDRGKDVALVNLGVPGANTDSINRRVQRFLRMDVNPHLITVWVGNNDLIDGVEVDEFEDELEELLSLLRARTEGPIVIANLPDLTRLPRFVRNPDRNVTRQRVMSFNNVIEEQAEEFDIAVIDLFKEQIEEKCVSDVDGFHPNNDGHERIAGLFLQVIEPELAGEAVGINLAAR